VPKDIKEQAIKNKSALLDPSNLSDSEKQLLKIGYPLEDLISLSTEQEKDLIAEGATYLNTEETGSTDSSIIDYNPELSTEIKLLSTKSSGSLKNFSHKLIISKLKTLSSGTFKGEVRLKLDYTFDWYEDPINNLTDKFAIGWDGGYTPDENSTKFKYVYYTSKGMYTGANSSGNDTTDKLVSNGVGWKFDIKGGLMNGKLINKHHGEASVIVTNPKANKIYARSKYFHQIIVVSGQLTVGADASLGISFATHYNTSYQYGKTWNN
jgi:hypothetical protein